VLNYRRDQAGTTVTRRTSLLKIYWPERTEVPVPRYFSFPVGSSSSV